MSDGVHFLQDLQASPPTCESGSRARASAACGRRSGSATASGEADLRGHRLHRRPRPEAEGRPHVALPRAVRGGDRGSRDRGGAARRGSSPPTSPRRSSSGRARCARRSRSSRSIRSSGETPVTDLPTQELVSLIGLAAASERATRRVGRRRGDRNQRLPCAQGLVRADSRERLRQQGSTARTSSGSSSSSRLRPTTSAAGDALRRHRAAGQRRAARPDRRGSMSAPGLWAAQEAGRAPRRRAGPRARPVRRGFGAPGAVRHARDLRARRRTTFCSRGRSTSRTIHDHDVIAEQFGTVGELRAELEDGRGAPRATPSCASGSRPRKTQT